MVWDSIVQLESYDRLRHHPESGGFSLLSHQDQSEVRVFDTLFIWRSCLDLEYLMNERDIITGIRR
jgi:hypothetical protein